MTENHHNDVIHMTSSCDVIENKNVENGRFEPFFSFNSFISSVFSHHNNFICLIYVIQYLGGVTIVMQCYYDVIRVPENYENTLVSE